jgi:hypothetical protein
MKKQTYYIKETDEFLVLTDFMDATHKLVESDWETPQGPLWEKWDLDGNLLDHIAIPKEALVFEDE